MEKPNTDISGDLDTQALSSCGSSHPICRPRAQGHNSFLTHTDAFQSEGIHSFKSRFNILFTVHGLCLTAMRLSMWVIDSALGFRPLGCRAGLPGLRVLGLSFLSPKWGFGHSPTLSLFYMWNAIILLADLKLIDIFLILSLKLSSCKIRNNRRHANIIWVLWLLFQSFQGNLR